MPTSSMSTVIPQLHKAICLQDELGMTDAELLERFIEHRDEAAFAVLIRRHGSMVMGVCLRVVRNHQDAEDAFQATFLVLVRKATSIASRGLLANWLYGVAYNTALKAKVSNIKRQAKEKQVATMPDPVMSGQELWNDDRKALLDQEISRLPKKYRVPILLCDLEGKTRKEAAQELGCPEGSLSSRLSRARGMLAKRLARHGLAVSGGSLAAALSDHAASACVPTSAVASTIHAATLFATGNRAMISVHVIALAEGVLKAMLITKLKVTVGVSVALIASILAVYGIAVLTTDKSKQVVVRGEPNQPVAADENRNKLKEEQLQEVRVRHPKRIEVVPNEQFTGRTGAPQGDSIAVTFAVDERSFLRYQRLLLQHQVKGPGSTLYLALADENGFPHQGTLKGFDDRIDPETGTVQAQATLPNPDRLLLHGLFVRVRIPFGPPQNVIAVPDEACQSDQGKHYLMLVNGKDIVERRPVSLGTTEGDMRIIEKGVNEEDWIVVGGLNNAIPGTHVKRRIVDDAPQVTQPEKVQKDRKKP
jgi:RNA polymerase sigma factor (sigma-70 family)